MEEGLQDVAGTNSGEGGDREAELDRDREAEAVGAPAGAAHLELGPMRRERAVSEDRQRPQPIELLVQSHPRDQVIGMTPPRRQHRYLIRYHDAMESPNALVRELRLGAGLSQRALARRAGTSQPAVARYERGVATPSWGTIQRLASACGQRVRISAEAVPDPHDVELAELRGSSSA